MVILVKTLEKIQVLQRLNFYTPDLNAIPLFFAAQLAEGLKESIKGEPNDPELPVVKEDLKDFSGKYIQ